MNVNSYINERMSGLVKALLAGLGQLGEVFQQDRNAINVMMVS